MTMNEIKLEPNNLINPEAFRNWLKKGLESLYSKKKIPNAHLLIYLEYIKKMVNESQHLDPAFWGKLIRDLESDIQALERNNNEL